MRKHIFALTAVALSLAPSLDSTASEARHREHGAHAHGSGSLNVVVADHELMIELEIPAMNVVGFEHTPGTDDERRAVRQALEKFGRADSLFVPNSAAGCRVENVEVTLAGMEQAEGESTGHEHERQSKHGHAAHSELHGEYYFHCDAPEKLDSLQVRLFDHLLEMDEIDVQLVTPTSQSATALRAEATSLRLVKR